jgi:hypothetical protein
MGANCRRAGPMQLLGSEEEFALTSTHRYVGDSACVPYEGVSDAMNEGAHARNGFLWVRLLQVVIMASRGWGQPRNMLPVLLHTLLHTR